MSNRFRFSAVAAAAFTSLLGMTSLGQAQDCAAPPSVGVSMLGASFDGTTGNRQVGCSAMPNALSEIEAVATVYRLSVDESTKGASAATLNQLVEKNKTQWIGALQTRADENALLIHVLNNWDNNSPKDGAFVTAFAVNLKAAVQNGGPKWAPRENLKPQ